LRMALTPHHVVRNANGIYLIICGSTWKSFGRMSRYPTSFGMIADPRGARTSGRLLSSSL
jgi:hypothetical protein